MLDDIEEGIIQEAIENLETRPHDLNNWEKGFLEGIRDKFDSYGKRMLVSEKQLNCLQKVNKKLADKT